MWSTYRNNGLDGGGNRDDSNSESQESLTYPGNASRVAEDFVRYWMDVEAYIKGNPNVVETPRVTIPQNSRAQGVWVLAIADNMDTLVSYSGPRDVTQDIRTSSYDVANSSEAALGDTSGPNLVRSNYSPFHNTLSNEPVEIHNYRYWDYIPDDEHPEEIIISQWNQTKTGVVVTRKAYAWSYQDYDDFIIQELIFENRGTKTLDPVYINLENAFSVCDMGHHWPEGAGMSWSDWRANRLPVQDDIFHYTRAPNYSADTPESTSTYKQQLMVYQRDGDWFGTNWDDTGQPYVLDVASTHPNESQGQKSGQLLAFQYIGMGILDDFPPFVGDSETYQAPRQTRQPYAEKWWHNGNIGQGDFEDPTYTRQNDAQMFKMLTDTSGGSVMPDPDEATLVTHALVFGPYHLAPGQKAKLVIAFVGGSGADWEGEDEFSWSISPEAKSQLKEGEYSLFRNFRRAQFAYENQFDLPDPPPDVNIQFENNKLGQVVVKWLDKADDAVDPDYSGDEAKDVRGYRVYRSWPPSYNWHFGPWQLVAEIPVKDPKYYNPKTHMYKFADASSFAGYNYYYSVRTYDSGHDHWYDRKGVDHGPIPSLESGYAAPEEKNMIAITPYQPSLPEYDSMTDNIHVVPNPYRLDRSDHLHRYPDEADIYKIRFINLPSHCMIRIYSTSGDLIYEGEHRSRNEAEFSWRQDTISFSGRIVSGIYFWVVESLDPVSKGKIQKGVLAVVK